MGGVTTWFFVGYVCGFTMGAGVAIVMLGLV